MKDDYTFVVDPGVVAEIRRDIAAIAKRSRYTVLHVLPEEFTAWCVALEREYFYTHTSKNGHRWCSSGIAHVIKTEVTDEYRMVSVSCDTPPADWVTFPAGEGDRRWRFRAATFPKNNTEESK